MYLNSPLGRIYTHRISEKLDEEYVRDCLSGETLMQANHKVRCANSYQEDMQKVKSVSRKKEIVNGKNRTRARPHEKRGPSRLS